jgi:hypothetical protein
VQAALGERYLAGGASVTRADMAAAFRTGPAAEAARAGGAVRRKESFVDLEALLREARAAGGDALILAHDGAEEEGGAMV